VAERGRDAERARADALANRVHVMQADLAKAEAEGDALPIETAELTAQVKAAKAEAREAQDRAEELRQAEGRRGGAGGVWNGRGE
jgi:cell division protein FtsB